MRDEKNIKNSGSDSFLFSLFNRLVSMKGREQSEAPEEQEEQKEKKDAEAAVTETEYDTRNILDTPVENELLFYRMKWQGRKQTEGAVPLRSFIYDEDIPQEDVMKWMSKASKRAEELLEARNRRMEADVEDDSLDAELMVVTPHDGLSAWCFIFPALSGGRNLSSVDILSEITAQGIMTGIQKDRLELALQDEVGMKWFRIAQGTPPVHGTDGVLTENYPHTAGTPQLIEDEKGNVDFHELNWLIKINNGDEICRFTRATKGVDGKSVFGKAVKARNGKEVKLPDGKNTVVEEAEGRVLSEADGLLSYRNGKFHVAELLEIRGDVATATGNIDAQCDVLIHGSILSGYTVKSLGNIIVKGMVDRSTVIAGKDVYIAYGMAGGGTGTLDAGGTVRCKYLENVNVRATGDVITGSIVNSHVSCDRSIFVNIGRGAIIGGRLLAMDKIEAKIIGNRAHGNTILLIEPSVHFQEIKMQLGIEYANISANPEREEEKKRKDTLKKLIEEMEEREKLVKNGQIIADVIYPVAEVSFQEFSKTIEREENSVRLFRDSEGIKTGMK